MRVKKYQAVDMPEALRMIREELGADAVILSTRQVKPGKGVFGLLGRPLLEVTAATDLDAGRPSSARRVPPPLEPVQAAPYQEPRSVRPQSGDHQAFLSLQAEMESLREELDVLSRRPAAAARPDAALEGVRAEVRGLGAKLDRLLDQTAPVESMRLSPALRKLHGWLVGRDLDPALAGRLTQYLQEKVDAGAVAPGREVEAFGELVRRTAKVAGPLLARGVRVVALVGPTGVGKTTTVAKLAARFALQEGRRVGLITVDTFRIAAVEQLKTYAKIMGLPIEVALDASGVRAAVDALSDRDVVLVDTAGQSPRDEESLRELSQIFPPSAGIEVHLVLSVTTRGRDLERILRQYAPLRPSCLLLTKLDETECRGPLIGLPLASRLPLSYLTTGQNVPDDLEEATAAGIAEHLLVGLEADR